MTNEAHILCRYQVGVDGVWHLSTFNGAPDTLPRKAGTEPDWLKTILDVGAVADAFITPVPPPPYRILWFRVDQSYNLTRFGYE